MIIIPIAYHYPCKAFRLICFTHFYYGIKFFILCITHSFTNFMQHSPCCFMRNADFLFKKITRNTFLEFKNKLIA
jgi:hypothetical protein